MPPYQSEVSAVSSPLSTPRGAPRLRGVSERGDCRQFRQSPYQRCYDNVSDCGKCIQVFFRTSINWNNSIVLFECLVISETDFTFVAVDRQACC